MLTNHRILKNKTVSVLPWMVGLMVFGGVDPISECTGYQNSFLIAFSKKKNLEAWQKVGAAPLTMECLKSVSVRREIGDCNVDTTLRDIQEQNRTSTNLLCARGFAGQRLAGKLKEKTILEELTVPHS